MPSRQVSRSLSHTSGYLDSDSNRARAHLSSFVVRRLVAKAYAKQHVRALPGSNLDAVPTTTSFSSAIPAQLQGLASSHPLSTAFILGSTMTLTFISGIYLTRALFAVRPKRTAMLRAIGRIERRIESNQRNVEKQSALNKFSKTPDRENVSDAPSDISMAMRKESAKHVMDTGRANQSNCTANLTASSPMDPVSQRGVAKPISFDGRETKATAPAKIDRDTDRPPIARSSLPPFPASPGQTSSLAKTSNIPHKSESMLASVGTPTPKLSTASKTRSSSLSTASSPRPSILAFHGLRAGLGKMGPMPIVDVSNPNCIIYADRSLNAEVGSKSKVSSSG